MRKWIIAGGHSLSAADESIGRTTADECPDEISIVQDIHSGGPFYSLWMTIYYSLWRTILFTLVIS